MSEPILELESVSVSFGELRAVDDVSFAIEPGSITGLMGPNGAGKSTLLAAVAGVIRPSWGRIRLSGRDITRTRVARVCRLGMCMTHQTPRPFTEATVRENVETGSIFGSSRHSDERVDRVLEMCELARYEGHIAGDLGPSALRRLELARALATDPQVLLLDEVAAGMPTEEVAEIAEALRAVRASGVTIVLVEHVMDLLLDIAERLIVMDRGAKLADGTPDVVLRDGRVVTAYFGEELV